MALHPEVYAQLLGEKIAKHQVKVWLVNTGWTGGPYGVGHRMPIAYTRAMVKAALEGQLDDVPLKTDPIFGLRVPERVPGVPQEVMDVRSSWSDPAAYDEQARKLAQMFKANFETYAASVPEAVRRAGPQVCAPPPCVSRSTISWPPTPCCSSSSWRDWGTSWAESGSTDSAWEWPPSSSPVCPSELSTPGWPCLRSS